MIYTDTDSLKVDYKQTFTLTLEQIVDIVKHLQGDCEIRTPCAKYCLNATTSNSCDHAIATVILNYILKGVMINEKEILFIRTYKEN